jgi:FlaA1/EpsC-like NDP-sugar epimerase
VFAVPLWERIGRYGVILAADSILSAAAFRAAMALRFDEGIPDPWAARLWVATALVVASRLAANLAGRLHRWSFRRADLADAVRLATACVAGSALVVTLARWVAPPGVPPTVHALEFFLSSTGFALLRFGPRVALLGWSEVWRRRSAAPALVVGTTFAAESLARELRRGPAGRWEVVGFVGSDPDELGRRIDGTPVVGLAHDLVALVARHAARDVLLAIPRPAVARLRRAIAACASSGVRFRIVPQSVSLAEPVSAAMLDDLAPEDLLVRAPVELDRTGLRGRLAGASVLVTGAGLEIGGEACRQLAHLGVRQLLMVDADADRLERRARRLAAEQPGLDLRAERADLADARAVAYLGRRCHPRYVLHAALGEAVASREDPPGEAFRRDVLGTLHLARMARACGAERLVLASCVAHDPTRRSGATGRVAERVARGATRGSPTRTTVVRFGDVLGVDGSAVPRFVEQVARGGPVTVTHPECMRRFLTVPEAAGMLLAAGLGDGGELCVLDAGAPVRMDELARLAIALAGGAARPGVGIVYTGPRDGEPGRRSGSAEAAGTPALVLAPA